MDQPTEFKHLYVVEFVDGSIKLGVSKTPQQRINRIQTASGRIKQKVYVSGKLPPKKAFGIEAALKAKYKPHQMYGEFYKTDFDALTSLLAWMIVTNR